MGDGLREGHRSNGGITTAEKIVAICQPNFLPWLGYFEMGHRADVFVMLDDVQWSKNHWINRNRIISRSPEGWMRLTVPIRRGPLATLICDVEINNSTRWQDKMLKSIEQTYARAPYFSIYHDGIASLLGRTWHRLVDLNWETIRLLYGALGLSDNLVLSSDYGVPLRKDDKVAALCDRLDASIYLANNGARDYIDPSIFHSRGIGFLFQDYNHPSYEVKGFKFASHLSVLDLLFWHGPGALQIVLSGRDPDWRSQVTYGPEQVLRPMET